MKLKTVLAVMVVLAMGYTPAARADAGISEGCKYVGVALGAALGYGIGKGLPNWISNVTGALGAFAGADRLAARCENYFESWQRQREFDYDRFVEEICNGSPYACPNGWNSMGSMPGSPWSCEYFVVCSFPLAVRPDGSVSVQDIINAAIFVDLSRTFGYWDFHNFGYLVGLQENNLNFAPN